MKTRVLDGTIALAKSTVGEDPGGERAEFIRLVERSKKLESSENAVEIKKPAL